MSSKHFSNDAATLVSTSLRSLALTNSSVGFHEAQKTVFLKSATTTSNAIVISGGGSGHEPSFAGFVGKTFLSGAVAGSIFASPSADQVFRCLVRLGSQRRDAGILIIIMNYTGDKLHFGMAVEKARALGIRCELAVVSDDVGVGRAKSGRVGRRGLAGAVLVQKIAGALAAQGLGFEHIYKTTLRAAENVATVGASLAHVHVPGRAASNDDLGYIEEIEIGMGIHKEEGFSRIKTSLAGLVSTMLKQLLDQSDKDRAFINIHSGDSVALLINNLGGLSQLELGSITCEVVSQLSHSHGIRPKRVLAGTYMSSLNGLGFSITLLKLAEENWLSLIDEPTEASGWVPSISVNNRDDSAVEHNDTSDELAIGGEENRPSNLKVDAQAARVALVGALKTVIAAEPEVTKYDILVGDGDFGLCLKNGAEKVLSYITSQDSLQDDAARLVEEIALVVERSMDGTSGALYTIFLNALAHGVRQESKANIQEGHITLTQWGSALKHAMSALGTYTPAQPGDRTVVDALAPFINTFGDSKDVNLAVGAAIKGCESTKGMEASLGRSVYVGGEE
ncbi:Fc.00g024920.m01.CDS01 [Cosmosporella sp. VM-42]